MADTLLSGKTFVVTGGTQGLGGNPEQPSDVQAVVAWFPPTDFAKMDEQLAASGFAPSPVEAHSAAHSPESLILGGKITEIPDVVRAANPETYIRPGMPPFFIQHGTHDRVVPYQQSLNFAIKLAQVEPDKVTHDEIKLIRGLDMTVQIGPDQNDTLHRYITLMNTPLSPSN